MSFETANDCSRSTCKIALVNAFVINDPYMNVIRAISDYLESVGLLQYKKKHYFSRIKKMLIGFDSNAVFYAKMSFAFVISKLVI